MIAPRGAAPRRRASDGMSAGRKSDLPSRSPRTPRPNQATLALLAMAVLLSGCNAAGASTVGNAEQGAVYVDRAACGSCHVIPGVALADGQVGPPLSHFGSRMLIAGTLPNSPDDLTFWLRHPQQVRPGTTMPDTGLTEPQARDVAAFLYGLK